MLRSLSWNRVLLCALVALFAAAALSLLCVPQQAFALPGAQKDGKVWHAYNKSDKLMKKTFKLNGWTYYPDAKGVLRARSYKGVFYYDNGEIMTLAHAKDFKCLLVAEDIVRKVTRKSDSKATKLRKTFTWVLKKGYAIHRSWDPNRVAWPAVYAMDHFNNKLGDCHSDGAAFAYLAAAVGYKNVYVCNDGGKTTDDNHCWAMIGRAVYDPLFAQTKGWSRFYGATSGSYEVHPAHKYSIPQYNAKKHKLKATGKQKVTKAVKSSKDGLVTYKGAKYFFKNGSAVIKQWVKVKKYWYFFGKDGKAATGSVKIQVASKKFKKGVYYVFNKKGRLLTGTSTRNVKVDGKTYRVNKKGQAVKGWSGERYHLANGLMVTGLVPIKHKLYFFGENGTCDRELSKALQEATEIRGDFAPLRKLLKKNVGKLRGVASQHSCETVDGMAGDDIIYKCAGCEISVFKATNGIEYLMEF